jgi:hypothetical protein
VRPEAHEVPPADFLNAHTELGDQQSRSAKFPVTHEFPPSYLNLVALSAPPHAYLVGHHRHLAFVALIG